MGAMGWAGTSRAGQTVGSNRPSPCRVVTTGLEADTLCSTKRTTGERSRTLRPLAEAVR
jgi:hypothetical protein